MITVLESYPVRLYNWMNSNGEDLQVTYSSGDIEISCYSVDLDEFAKFGDLDEFSGSLVIPSYKDKSVVDVINFCLEQLGLDSRITLDDLRFKIRNTY